MPAATTTQVTASIRVVGGLLPADMITRIMTGKDVSASTPADYHVVGVRSVKDAAERHWEPPQGRLAHAARGDRPRAVTRAASPSRTGCSRSSTSTATVASSGCTRELRLMTAPRSSRSAMPGSTCPSTWSRGARTSTSGLPAAGCPRSRWCRSA